MDRSVDVTSPAVPTSFITLSTKPTARLSYSFLPASGSHAYNPLIVFLNGLGLPASSWNPTMTALAKMKLHPPMLSYDRYGQGLSTDRDPLDAQAPDPQHGHDSMSVVHDLHQLISQICTEKGLLNFSSEGSNNNDNSSSRPPLPPIFFVVNSIGGAIARLYAHQYPSTVSAILFLDSVAANADLVSVWPDPDAPGFAAEHLPLPTGVTADALRETRAKYAQAFHPVTGIMGKAEGFSRRNLADLLPYADRPVLRFGGEAEGGQEGGDGGGGGPWVTVVGHGFEAFAEEGLKVMGTPIAATQTYINPYWNRYNEGLAKITSPARSKGPIQAKKCGHFIQRDDPEFVVHEVVELLHKQGVPIV